MLRTARDEVRASTSRLRTRDGSQSTRTSMATARPTAAERELAIVRYLMWAGKLSSPCRPSLDQAGSEKPSLVRVSARKWRRLILRALRAGDGMGELPVEMIALPPISIAVIIVHIYIRRVSMHKMLEKIHQSVPAIRSDSDTCLVHSSAQSIAAVAVAAPPSHRNPSPVDS